MRNIWSKKIFQKGARQTILNRAIYVQARPITVEHKPIGAKNGF
jgi:hypothetical protein